jgi:GT2 family glycosyltransferase
MKPLIIVISYNRLRETQETIAGLKRTGAFDEGEVFVFDNGSIDGTERWLHEQVVAGELPGDRVWVNKENIGCPQALNRVMAHARGPGQDVIKVDNDVVLERPGWVGYLQRFLEEHPEVGLVGPVYRELREENQGRVRCRHDGWLEVFPLVGHCVMHRGELLEETGFFDVLRDDHLYGFEDNLMCHRAGVWGYKCAVSLGVSLRNIQRHNSLDRKEHRGERCREHVERMRPYYEQRVKAVHRLGKGYYVGRDGRPVVGGKR